MNGTRQALRAVIAVAALGVAAVAACGPDSQPFQLALEFQRGESFKCSSDSCANVAMTCQARMLVRIADTEDESIAWLSECIDITPDGSMCSLGDISLPSVEVPNQVVRVQVAVWPYDALTPEQIADGTCPPLSSGLFFLEQIGLLRPTPALAGVGYIEVGASDVATVVLGCIDEVALSAPTCNGDRLELTTHVTDFETLLSVDGVLARRLTVSVGEPSMNALGAWTLDDAAAMELAIVSPTPTWRHTVVQRFATAACVEVIGIELQAAATLHCTAVPDDDEVTTLAADGVEVDDATLDKIEQAIGGLPDEGLVIGKVLDADKNAKQGAVVTPTHGTVMYLSDDLTMVTGSSTSSSGMFVSLDAPFEGPSGDLTSWHASEGSQDTPSELGGRVAGKVTVVLLEFDPVSTMP